MEAANIGSSSIKSVLLFISLILIQVLICNNILLFGVAVPFIFIYFIFNLPLGVNKNILILVSFLLGFSIDLFSDTMGLNSASCLILALCKQPVFYSYMPREDKNIDITPSIKTMGWENYIKYALTLSAIYCIIIFAIEYISFSSFWHIILMTVSSTILTSILIIGTDSLVSARRRNR